jgi:2-dehydro-3-deoxyphosphogluconate aldolase / (4S)-4-hydroxy-2-oxoglutarate aldolase
VTQDPVSVDRRDPVHVLGRLLAPEVGGVVGVLRSASAAHALVIADAAAEAGLACIEITWTTPGAADVVRALRERRPELLVGAGSIFDEAQAHEAWEAGAAFLVSPHLAHGVSDVCRSLGALYVPGAATASEVVAATERGHPLVKLFPIAQLGGAEFVRALRGPIPGLRAMVTGGVGPDEVAGYLAAGAVLVGLGSVFGSDADETRRRVARLFPKG